MARIRPKDFRLPEGGRVDLDARPTRIKPFYATPDDYEAQLARHTQAMEAQQQMLTASGAHALLLIVQAMDAGGKDGMIRHVMSGLDPQACQVASFKTPSETEKRHDFLWRAVAVLPERGRIGVFNRSYYEDVLIVRVHPELVPGGVPPGKAGKAFWQERYHSIRALERHLGSCGTRIAKIYLHMSPDEQRQRFLARIDEPDKNWKFGIEDVEERKFWKDYMRAYEKCLEATSTAAAPWYVVPADDKRNARLITARILLDTAKALKLKPASVTEARRQELQAIRDKLAAS